MQIRRATASDFSKLLAIDDAAQTDAARKRWLRGAIRRRIVYVLTAGGPPVAYGIVAPSFFNRPFIEMLYVVKEERRKGHGGHLLSYLESRGLRNGEVWTSTNRSNKAMRSLLKKNDFALSGRVSGLDEGDPELFYKKKRL